jgi:chemotaxis protein methyltransferase CheR
LAAPLSAAAAPPRSPAATESSVAAARVYADQGEWDKAAKLCRQLIAENPLHAGAHFILGLVAEHSGSAPEAEASFRKAIYLDRSFALAHYHLGLALHNHGKRGQARKSFENTVELLRSSEPDEPLPHGDGIRAGELRELAEMHLEKERLK